MPKVLTEQQVDDFQEVGFLSPIDVMSEQDATAILDKLEEVEQNHPEQVNAENRNNPHLCLLFLDNLVHHPIIIDAVSDLIGDNIALWGTVLFIKEPQSQGYVSWHQDATYMGIEPHNFVSPWIALTPSNRTNGCMSMIPGSHKSHIQSHDDTFDKDNILTRGQAIHDVDTSSAVDLILRPGQMSIHHSEIIHGSQPNQSDQRRVGYVMQGYMPPSSSQVLGENYWMQIRGENLRQDSVQLRRPKYDLDPDGVAQRKQANDNWANILYQGAKQKRLY